MTPTELSFGNILDSFSFSPVKLCFGNGGDDNGDERETSRGGG